MKLRETIRKIIKEEIDIFEVSEPDETLSNILYRADGRLSEAAQILQKYIKKIDGLSGRCYTEKYNDKYVHAFSPDGDEFVFKFSSRDPESAIRTDRVVELWCTGKKDDALEYFDSNGGISGK